MLIHTENLPNLLEDIAELIGARARRRSVRSRAKAAEFFAGAAAVVR